MHLLSIQRLLGLLLMIFSVTLLPPVAVSLIYQDGQAQGAILLEQAGVSRHNLGATRPVRL